MGTHNMSFTGFTDDVGEDATEQEEGMEVRRVKTKKTREKMLATMASIKTNSVVGSSDSLPAEARLAQPQAPTPVKMRVSDSGKCEILAGGDPPRQTTVPHQDQESEGTKISGEVPSKAQNISEIQEEKISKLEAFQVKQKLIEEQNRKRKEMLSKAIMDRKKKTDSETKKLELVRQELEKIDLMLNTDVQFLRDSIEQASMEFMEAQKRYDRAEKEFVESKLNLFSSMERKELLTDHLCTIIEQNEIRKAKKLNALMEELELDTQ